MVSFILCLVVSFFAVFGVYRFAAEIFKAVLLPAPESITLRVKNCENDIEYTLRTLLMEYPKSSIVVVDADSTDNTLDIVKRLAAKHTRIKIK